MQTFTFIMALTMGLAGSLHCAGMCGPIMWVMPFQAMQGMRKWLTIALYHTGRISVYAGMGVLLYSFRSSFTPQLQQYISIGTGALLLVAGLLSFIPGKGIRLPWGNFVRNHLGHFLSKPTPMHMLMAGVLNGLLPCGLVYMALAAAINAPSVGEAAALMYVFGAGTLPVLISITLLKQKLLPARVTVFRKYLPVVMFCMGALFILRGMNLGIPYISPAIDIQTNTLSGCCQR
jgi:sulfite exporter TauE/SafE